MPIVCQVMMTLIDVDEQIWRRRKEIGAIADGNYKTLVAELQCWLLWCSCNLFGCTFNRKLHIVVAKLNCFVVM